MVQVYGDVQSYTHWSIRYAMVDSRLFPFSGSNTGIFYALGRPHRPGDRQRRQAPTAFYTLSVVGSDGKHLRGQRPPAGVTAVNYNINYLAPFYNSMIYKTFIGYSEHRCRPGSGDPGHQPGPSDRPDHARLDVAALPGRLPGHVASLPLLEPQRPLGVFLRRPISPMRRRWRSATTGPPTPRRTPTSRAGKLMLQVFPYQRSQPLIGTVTLPSGAPVSQARVTVYDSWGIPHMTTPR